ncbi:MAG: UvrD-helicase domain-containing protein [Acidobacteriota bacterium]|nr:UvrD-helicase domain-containing protein [Acidobacteriota bacterium]
MSRSIVENRELIKTELDQTMVVEAAAGTGKTTELVGRIVALIENERARIGEIVAVTFSEKAAGELKLRLREELERARARRIAGSPESALLARAIYDFEEAHVSTIHGFCAELLRERPVEARVDPAFTVLTETQADHLFDEAFTSWLHDQLDRPQEGVRRSLRRPVLWRPDDEETSGPIERLRRAARELREWRDHTASWLRPPYDRHRAIKTLCEQLRAFAEMTARPLKKGDNLSGDTKAARVASSEIERQRRLVGDMIPESVYDGWEAALVGLADNRDFAKPRKGSGAAFAIGVTRDQALAAHTQLLADLGAFRDRANADLAALLREEMRDCLDRYEARKQEAGALDFLDLLIKARDLVNDDESVREQFRKRFRVLLVDEFQDTDPLQADLLLLLAGTERNTLRPGALFIVGDPKQSIYRFRRADVGAYRRISEELGGAGATAVTLQTSFRSVPAIQHFVNAAFRDEMNGDQLALQADYVNLLASRADHLEQPAVVALPVPRPYGRRDVTQGALATSQPPAIGQFVKWLLSPECSWTVGAGRAGGAGGAGEKRRRIVASDICLLFRRFMHYGGDVTRDYVEALEARGVPHLLVGGKTFHEREEVDAIRTALTAIEWPEDELSVYATLHGPLFAIGEEELLEYHAAAKMFHPYRVPGSLPAHLQPVVQALGQLRELHATRNHRPVADTLGRLIAITRAHAGFILWRGGEQVLANVLHVADMARRYEMDGGLSFRGFVDTLHDASGRGDAPEAPILEEGSEGVRLMTVHKAKGLEFPVVILADIGCKLSQARASRYLDSAAGLCAISIGGWSPQDLLDHNDEEAARDQAEGVRLAYVAATRARDVLVVPAVGDGPYQKGWVTPLNRALYPPKEQRQSPSPARGVPLFKGKDTVLPDARPDGQQPDASTVRPGTYALFDPESQVPYSVVWWDPVLLDVPADDPRGLRRDDLISKDASATDVATDRARYDEWKERRAAVQAQGSAPSMIVTTPTQLRESGDDGRPVSAVVVEDASVRSPRPSGKRFGTLVHALLASVPLTANASEVEELAALHAKLLGATDEEQAAARVMVVNVLKHPRLAEARAAEAAGHRLWREVPVALRIDDGTGTPQIVDGQIDLAYETGSGWMVIDFKTDIEIATAEDAYVRQVSIYLDAVTRATGQPATGLILKI